MEMRGGVRVYVGVSVYVWSLLGKSIYIVLQIIIQVQPIPSAVK